MRYLILIILFSLMTLFPVIGQEGDEKEETTAAVILCGPEIKSTASGTTYYVRPDGGTASQCTGTTDAAYPGSGSNQPCAWSHPFYALTGGGNWKLQGGDTLIIASGSYMMGYGAPNTSGWCDSDYPYDCDLPPLPSGPGAARPTRILGKGWDMGCANPPELWGTERPWNILDLTGTSNAYIACLEITDHSSCVEHHANPAAECKRDTYPYGDWASDGLTASDSSNVTLQDLNIHGLASAGVRAGRLTDWTIRDVRIAGNGWVGWEGDLNEDDSSNSGTILFDGLLVEWNGCGETYPDETPHNCWGQTAGGYGDGLGTAQTGGHWMFRDSIFRYNTSDGLDLLYARNDGSQIDIQRFQAYGNAGNALKTTGNAAIENALLIGDCGFFDGQSFTYHVDNCRAAGNTFSASLRRGTTVSLVNSTLVGQGDCLIGIECDTESSTCNGSETVIIQNNIFQGYPEFDSGGDTACYIWFDDFNMYDTRIDYNVIYGVKMGGMSYAAHDITSNPLFVNSSLSAFDGHLQSGSPAIDSGLAVGSLNGLIPSNDLEGAGRPAGNGTDRGAYEYGGTSGGGDAEISLDPSRLFYGAAGNSATAAQKVRVSNSAGGTMNWTANSNQGWLTRSPASGTDSGTISVSVNPSGLSTGTHTGAVSVASTDASNSPQTISVTLEVYASGSSSAPFGKFSTPAGGAAVSSSIPVTGWVLDDIECTSVKIYREADGGLVYIGDALFVEGARPDVEQLYPDYPFNNRAGWGYMMLTNFLPNGGNGTFTFHAVAEDAEGHQTALGVKTITVDNANAVKPFGAIDTPAQGGSASGSAYRNNGWVLTPMPNTVPTDGSTINVYVDGVYLGHPGYNIYRPDIAALFPGYANSQGAAAYFDLDTTAYADGVHTIQWSATDDAGNTDGIGSRYFTVQNTGDRGQGLGVREKQVVSGECWVLSEEAGAVSGLEAVPVMVKKGYDRNNKLEDIHPDENGYISVEINELQRLEIHLPPDPSLPLTPDPLPLKNAAPIEYHGYSKVGSQWQPLPIGSTLDPVRGVFSWSPGPGFVGDYQLVFKVKKKNGVIISQKIIIKILPES